MQVNNNNSDSISSFSTPTPILSKGQKKRAKEKLKKAPKPDIEKSQQALVQTAVQSAGPKFPSLTPEMREFSNILFSSISFDTSRSVIDAWGIYCAKTIRNIKTTFEKTKNSPILINLLESQFQLYYYLIQVYYQKLDCLSRSVDSSSIFEDTRYFPSLDKAQGKDANAQVEEIIASIPFWKQNYLQQSKMSKQRTEQFWSLIEKDLRAQCDLLIKAIDFMKGIVLHPLAKDLMIRPAEENFSNAAIMVKEDVEQTKEDLACLLDLMEKSIDESIKAKLIGGIVTNGVVKSMNQYYKRVKDKKVLPHEDVIKFFQLQLKEEAKMDEAVALNEMYINKIVDDPFFNHDVWCKENNIQKVREKSNPEFLSMMYNSYISSMILHDFFEIFSTILSRHVIEKASPERMKIDQAALNKFVFGFTIVERLKRLETRQQFLHAYDKSFVWCKEHPAVAVFKLRPFFEEAQDIIKKMFSCIDNQTLDPRTFKEALMGQNATLDKLWRINRDYQPFKAKVLEINQALGTILKAAKKSVEATILTLPVERANEEIQLVNELFKTLHLVMTTTIAAPVLVVNEMEQLIGDSWASGEHNPHKTYSDGELKQDLINAIERIVPNLSFDLLPIPEKPKTLPLKIEPVAAVEDIKPVPVTVHAAPAPVPVAVVAAPAPVPALAPAAKADPKTMEPSPKIEKTEKKPTEEKIPKSIKVRELLKMLYDEGFKGVRMRGDHLIVERGSETFSVPVAKTHVSPGILNSIQKVLKKS